jgi:hypothetical protein
MPVRKQNMEGNAVKKKEEDKEAVQAIQVRFPAWMYEELKDRAQKERRSFNNEVIHLIQVLFDMGDMVEKAVEKAKKETAREGSGGKADV